MGRHSQAEQGSWSGARAAFELAAMCAEALQLVFGQKARVLAVLVGVEQVVVGPESPLLGRTARRVGGVTRLLADPGEVVPLQPHLAGPGSTWDPSGTATAGKLAGAQLELLPADSPFWFAWAAFRPDTRIWQP